MGLIQAFKGSVSAELANQWKEFFVCDSMSNDVLLKRATHKISGKSSNTKGEQDVITKDSVVIVNEGQCALLVDSGKIIDVAAEAGAYSWEENGSASIFAGNFAAVFKEFGRRFTFGGEKPVQQRVYFVNTKDITGLKFGTPTPIPFRILDNNIGFDLDTSLKCNGNYSMQVSDPTALYTNLAGNVRDEYTIDDISDQLRATFIQALQPALGQLSEMGIRPSGVPGHTKEISDAMAQQLNTEWTEKYGLAVTSVQILSAVMPEDDQATLKELQKTGAFRSQAMAGATLVQAQAAAMQAAASNANGAAMGFYGLNMATQAGGANAADLLNAGAAQQAAQQQAMPQQGMPAGQPMGQQGFNEVPQGGQPQAGRWFCPNCGNENYGNFCVNCGTKRP
ncbi:SPFH domain-containing protein [Pseudobutyrivibrio xylanivorans]|uniref:Membrane protease subunit, stomatin/prohibitin family, contains C-terminal Zn-ribbon domain n=1 Tax=Pseudobutyrivibrio xylanivorans TaxID=185007 RepID=A0A1G5RSW2_PSEXY|nr:SPFH domain-containing protein [Pseudobutyrivibrio xylanivorans]SCZ76389.1 Membrane protease subunit, stomatin/prohibitin family, contains C-terminal Zn-ribbon domain [Pseudobutyrivibrio xylanivorans]